MVLRLDIELWFEKVLWSFLLKGFNSNQRAVNKTLLRLCEGEVNGTVRV